jgi:hypothetical protein
MWNKKNNLHLAQCFDTYEVEGELDQECREENKVIPSQAKKGNMVREEEDREKGRRKSARGGLSQAKY